MTIDTRRIFDSRGYGITVEQANQRLETIYHELNETRFDGKLPSRPTVKVDLGAMPSRATFNQPMQGFVSIYVSPFCEPELYRRTLLHEMCHFFSKDHGSLFRAKLAEVAHGEPWLKDDLRVAEWQERTERLEYDAIKVMGELMRENPSLGWVQARSEVARRLGCKVGELRGAMWDFERFWKRLCESEKKDRSRKAAEQEQEGK